MQCQKVTTKRKKISLSRTTTNCIYLLYCILNWLETIYILKLLQYTNNRKLNQNQKNARETEIYICFFSLYLLQTIFTIFLKAFHIRRKKNIIMSFNFFFLFEEFLKKIVFIDRYRKALLFVPIVGICFYFIKISFIIFVSLKIFLKFS